MKKLTILEGEVTKVTAMTEGEWRQYLVCCDLKQLAVILSMNQLDDCYRAIYLGLMGDNKMTFERRLMLFLAMINSSGQFTETELATPFNAYDEAMAELMYQCIIELPKHQHYTTFVRCTRDRRMPGLFNLLDCIDGFEYFLSLMPSSERLNAFLVKASGVLLIQICIPNNELMGLVFKYLSREQRVVLFSARDQTNLTIFSSMIPHYPLIEQVIANHTTQDLIHWCNDKQPVFQHNSVIISYVLRHWGTEEIKQSILAMLHALPYQERQQLLNFRDATGASLVDVVPQRTGDASEYRSWIAGLQSQESECVRLFESYEAINGEFDREHIEIESMKDLLNAVFQLELRDFLGVCKKIAFDHTLVEFKQQFENLCTVRSFESANSELSYIHMPHSLTNQLIVELLFVLYDIDNMKDLLRRLAGFNQVSLSHCVIEIPEVFPVGLSYREKMQFFRHSEPRVRIMQDLSSLAHLPPTLTALSSLAFADKVIINLNDIRHYSFQRHLKLYQMLKLHHPTIADAIYQHNSEWSSLRDDLEAVLKTGYTPKESIERLIQGLQRGGEAFTGSGSDADQWAYIAVADFMNYYRELPLSLRQSLEALGKLELIGILSKLNNYHCVEQLAGELKAFLHTHHEAPCLHERPGLSTDAMARLEKKCRVGLGVEKDETLLKHSIPARIAEKLISAMHLSDLHLRIEVLDLIPDVLLPELFCYIELEDEVQTFARLHTAFTNGFFTEEKKMAVLAAIIPYKYRFQSIYSESSSLLHLYSHYDQIMTGSFEAYKQFISRLSSWGIYNYLKLGDYPRLEPLMHRLFHSTDVASLERLRWTLGSLAETELRFLLKDHIEYESVISLVLKMLPLDGLQALADRLGESKFAKLISDAHKNYPPLYDKLKLNLSEEAYQQKIEFLSSIGCEVPYQRLQSVALFY